MNLVIVDTSVLIDLLKGKENEATRLYQICESKGVAIAIPHICCQEILQGVKSENEAEILSNYLLTQNIIQPKDSVKSYFEAAKIYRICRRKGITIRSTIDCIIAQMVLERPGATLLQNDKDFSFIATLFPLKLTSQ